MAEDLDPEAVIEQVAASPYVARVLRERAERMLPVAQRTAYNAGADAFADTLRVETGTRPGTKSPTGLERPYARVIGDSTEEIRDKDTRAKLTRAQILRRSTRG